MNEYFSRERLAGYDRAILDDATVGLVGAGALGNNVAQSLGLAGVREIRAIDMDYIEPSNLTRSPLFARLRTSCASRRTNKAKELALSVLQLSYAADPVVRYAPTKLETLGMGALLGCDVVVAAVDSAAVRALIAEWTRLLGIPLVEAGFSGLRGNVSAYRNLDADEPCYGCLNPSAIPERVSCRTYAAAVTADGRTPATQTIAALMGALVAETVIRFLHKEYGLAGHVFSIDSATWRTTKMKLNRDLSCRCAHRRIDHISNVFVTSKDLVSAIFDAIPGLIDPELRLPAPYIASLPCVACGKRVRIAKPQWQLEGIPRCPTCGGSSSSSPVLKEAHENVLRESPLSAMSCHRLGMASRSVVEVYDRANQTSHWVQLAGTLDDLFVTRTRNEIGESVRHSESSEGMDQSETEVAFRML